MTTAIKMQQPSNLDKLVRQLTVSLEVVTMIRCHEALAQVNVHSHGRIIEDIVELTRRTHELAKAFQYEVQGR